MNENFDAIFNPSMEEALQSLLDGCKQQAKYIENSVEEASSHNIAILIIALVKIIKSHPKNSFPNIQRLVKHALKKRT